MKFFSSKIAYEQSNILSKFENNPHMNKNIRWLSILWHLSNGTGPGFRKSAYKTFRFPPFPSISDGFHGEMVPANFLKQAENVLPQPSVVYGFQIRFFLPPRPLALISTGEMLFVFDLVHSCLDM